MVYDMALRAWHGICYGMVGMAWYMVLLGEPGMVYGMSWRAWHGIRYCLARYGMIYDVKDFYSSMNQNSEHIILLHDTFKCCT